MVVLWKSVVRVTLTGRSREEVLYLQFFIQYWDRLPARMVFTHYHLNSYHTTDIQAKLNALDPLSFEFAGLADFHKKADGFCPGETVPVGRGVAAMGTSLLSPEHALEVLLKPLLLTSLTLPYLTLRYLSWQSKATLTCFSTSGMFQD